MPVFDNINAPLRRCFVAAVVFLLAVPAFAGRGPEVDARIPLDRVGFEPQTPQFLLAGRSMMTLDYVDNDHLLFTFGVHRLMERIENDPPGDEDRVIEAVLLEASSGRVLARTDWRLHDGARYLWNLGQGRFLLRVRNTLTSFMPLANLASGQPFRQYPFLSMPNHIGVVLLSPESDLAVVETADRAPQAETAPASAVGPAPKPTPVSEDGSGNTTPVTLYFYRLYLPEGSKPGEPIRAVSAGVARSIAFGGVPVTGAGHLAIVDQGNQHWAFDFHPYAGKVMQLSPFDSTCRPIPHFVSSSEFVSFGCHGGNIPQVMGGFNMSGDEMWEQNLFGDFVAVSFSFAPQGGRFAMGRVLGDPALDFSGPVLTSDYTSESVTVYQTESGKQVFHTDCSPIARAGQNFALSPDGRKLAVIRNGAIEVFALPAMSTKDQAELKEARAMIPAVTDDPIALRVSTPKAAAPESAPAPKPTAAAPAAAPASSAPDMSDMSKAVAAAASAPGATSVTAPPSPPAGAPAGSVPPTQPVPQPAGDAAPEQPRKPPTLYTLPTDPPNKGNASEDR